MAEKMDEIPSNEENMDHNTPADQDDGTRGEFVIFSYDELSTATNNFASSLGRQTFGTVYKGKLLQTDQIVVVKKMDANGIQSYRMFLKEVITLSILRHPNIVNLIGFSSGETPEQLLLVYKLMPSGSLHDCLNEMETDSKLSYWKTRMTIALGTAKALDYLHNEAKPPVVSIDLKSANILLDQSFHPKLSDFGISEFNLMPPPDSALIKYYTLLMKTDVYDFGVVLFELITGRSNCVIQQQGVHRHCYTPFAWLESKMSKLEEAVDPRMVGKYDMRSLGKAAHLALDCLQSNFGIRPNMRDVVQRLSAIYLMITDLHKLFN